MNFGLVPAVALREVHGDAGDRLKLSELGVVLEHPVGVLQKFPLLHRWQVARVCEVHVLPVQEHLEQLRARVVEATDDADALQLHVTSERDVYDELRVVLLARAALGPVKPLLPPPKKLLAAALHLLVQGSNLQVSGSRGRQKKKVR